MRPNCLLPDECRSKSDRTCHKCMMTARNKSPEMRAAVRADVLRNPRLTPDAVAKSRTPEVRERASDTRLERAGFWCPKPYRSINKKLSNEKMPLEQRKAEIARMIADDEARRPVVLMETFSERIERSHNKLKRGGRFIGGSISPIVP